MRHGDSVDHFLNSAVAHWVVLSVCQYVHVFGMPDASVSAGVMNRKVCALTKFSLIVCSIFGMWQATHWLPALPSAWCVCSVTVPRKPAGFCLVWQNRHSAFPGVTRFAVFALL